MLLGQPRGRDPATAARTRQGAVRWAVGLAVVLCLAATAALVGIDRAVGLADGVGLDLGDYPREVELGDYGPRGSQIVGYDHGVVVEAGWQLRNAGVVPLRVTAIEPFPETLGMLAVEQVRVAGRTLPGEPVTLRPGERASVTVLARFDHCEYYTERAVNVFAGARVHREVLGTPGVETVRYAHDVVLRAPTINDCPDRVTDRGARQRSEDATITGRG